MFVHSFIHLIHSFIHSLVDRVRGLKTRFVFKHTHKTWGYKVVHSGYPTHICETEQDFGSPEEAEAASDLERNESRQCGRPDSPGSSPSGWWESHRPIFAIHKRIKCSFLFLCYSRDQWRKQGYPRPQCGQLEPVVWGGERKPTELGILRDCDSQRQEGGSTYRTETDLTCAGPACFCLWGAAPPCV